ncbi:MAG TPA: rhodanese-like domain-containing protein [Burkholderiaceae bacterium]|mgnify:CR=1 FL=1|nr:rhodanese-like domain-containing protein [Burkholderiaceae bacterium]
MKRYTDLITDALARVREILPWDLVDLLAQPNKPLVIDVREPSEFEHGHIAESINVPRGILESSCDWDYEDTIPSLAGGGNREIVVVCRSGNRSVLAVDTMQQLGYTNVVSLKTGIRGWNDYEQPLVDKTGTVIDIDHLEELLTSRVRPDQLRPR